MRDFVFRGIATVIAVLVYGWVNFLLNPVGVILSGQVAGKQFEPSNMEYITSVVGIRIFSDFGIPAAVLLVVLLAIWWRYIQLGWNKMSVLVLALIVMGGVPSAQAYYQQTDWPEIYFILPNESAFWIPDVGDNKTSQAKFMSEQYLTENKIPAKRFQIPHVRLPKSAYFSDYYVPAGRLIIVDRTPYSREWVASADRGTSKKNESFQCQSSEGLDMNLGISIGTSVLEEDAPRFLYRFGVKPPVGDRTKPEVIFSSIYWGKSLTEVMDNVVRNKIQSLICQEYTARTLDVGNKETPAIIRLIETSIRTYLKSVGITLDFIGLADTINLDKEVQKAINDRYIAEKVAPVMDMLERQAKITAITQKWNGWLPWAMSDNFNDFISKFFGLGRNTAPQTAPAQPAKK